MKTIVHPFKTREAYSKCLSPVLIHTRDLFAKLVVALPFESGSVHPRLTVRHPASTFLRFGLNLLIML